MKEHCTTNDTEPNFLLWGEIRFAVIGHLIFSPPDRGQLGAEIRRLAERTWKHPISGQNVRFSGETIERWYYQALNAKSNPIFALGAPRSDAGSHRALSNDAYAYLRNQFNTHRRWSYQKHYNKLDEIAQKRHWGSLPSYQTIRRYLCAMEQSLEREPTEQIDKLERLVAHLRKCLITQSVEVHLLGTLGAKNLSCGSERYSQKLGSFEKQYVLDRLRDYKRAGGKVTVFCHSIGISEATIQRWSNDYGG